MGFKNWPAWLKGGLLVLLFAIIFGFPIIMLNASGHESVVIKLLSLSWIYDILFGNMKMNAFTLVIAFTIFYTAYFLLGAIIGLIVGKIKQRNK